jgi:hypothetical protein|tara:strand:+ start:2916 stop:3170 length:255 start_codon:yes stop_codon:yes gene_type:complete
MAYTKTPRPYKKEYQQSLARGEHEGRMERQRARRDYDKRGVDRTGKDISHAKPISKGGTNKDGTKLASRSKNRAAGGAMSKSRA